MAADRLQKQLHKWKERIQDHSQKGLSGVDLEVFLLEKAYSNELEAYNQEIEAANAKRDAKSHRLAHVVGK
jgi:predicted  nucleic acid-binding Zn-ribbon protein